MLGFIHCLDARFGWWDDRETAIIKARAYADRALQLDPNNADGHITLGLLCWLQGQYDEAAFKCRKAVQLAPGSADVAALASFILTPSGSPEEGLVLIQKACALSPNHPPMYLGNLGNAYRLSGQIGEAIAAFEAYNARGPGFGLVDLVIAYQENGQADKAKDAAKRLLSARRDFTIAAWLKTQFRRDTARLDADIAALCPEGDGDDKCGTKSRDGELTQKGYLQKGCACWVYRARRRHGDHPAHFTGFLVDSMRRRSVSEDAQLGKLRATAGAAAALVDGPCCRAKKSFVGTFLDAIN